MLGGATGIGFAPVLVRLTDTGPTATAFYRLLFALPLLWAWSAWEQRKDPTSTQPRTASDFACLILTGLLFTADLSIWHWSLQFTNVANSTLLTNVAPIFVTIGASLFLHETITRNFLVGLVLAISGSVLLVGTSIQVGTEDLKGDVLAIVAAIFYGGYLLMVKYLRRRFATATIMAWAGLASCPAFGIVALASGDAMRASSWGGWDGRPSWLFLWSAMSGARPLSPMDLDIFPHPFPQSACSGNRSSRPVPPGFFYTNP